MSGRTISIAIKQTTIQYLCQIIDGHSAGRLKIFGKLNLPRNAVFYDFIKGLKAIWRQIDGSGFDGLEVLQTSLDVTQ